jgi:nitroreductase
MVLDVKQAIAERRAYRSLEPTPISEALIKDLAGSASLAPSCFNYQPWRFIFVQSRAALQKLHTALSKHNDWVKAASCMVVVYSKKDLDCQMPGRDYYLFDTGMAVGLLMLRATELGLVAHPIAGYDEDKVKDLLGIPKEMTVITLVNIGKHSATIGSLLTEKQAQDEKTRPPRKPLEEIMSIR